MGRRGDTITGEERKCIKDKEGLLRFDSRIWIPNVQELKREILQEAHSSRYSIHPGSTKMYRDFKRILLVAEYEERDCQLGE